jgi:hypothetical protein
MITHTHKTVLTPVKCAVVRLRALMARHSVRLIRNRPIVILFTPSDYVIAAREVGWDVVAKCTHA